MNIYKAFTLYLEGKIPRKDKKRLLGNKLTKSKISRLLKVVTTVGVKTMYERPRITPFSFCPQCGCKHYYGSVNMETYPEHYEVFKCLRCNNEVGIIANSPFYHVLQFPPDYKFPY